MIISSKQIGLTGAVVYDISYADLAGANSGQRPDLLVKSQAIYRTPDGFTYAAVGGRLVGSSASDLPALAAKTEVIIGDSLTGQNCTAVSISSISVSNGIVTVSTTAAHQMRTGQRCNVSGTTNSTFHVRRVPITWISATSFSYPSATATGTATGGGVLPQNQYSQTGHWVWGNALSGGRRILLANLGVGGETSAQILARFSEALELNPDILDIGAGTNDVIQDVPYASIIANLDTMVTQGLSNGRLVKLRTLPPFMSGGPYYSAVRNAAIQNINTWIRNKCATTKNLILVDVYAALINPLDANGYGKSALYTAGDSIHYNGQGAWLIGKLEAAAMAPFLALLDLRVKSITDNYGSNSNNVQLNDRGPWTPSGGTVNAPATGTAPTGWIVDAGGTFTVAPAVTTVVRPDGYGYDITVLATPGASGNNYTVRTDSTAQNTRLPLFAGQMYRWVFHVSIAGGAGGKIRSLDVYASMSVGGVSGVISTAIQGVSTAGQTTIEGDETLVFTTAPFVIPQGAVANCSAQVKVNFDGAGTASTVKVGNVSMVPVLGILP